MRVVHICLPWIGELIWITFTRLSTLAESQPVRADTPQIWPAQLSSCNATTSSGLLEQLSALLTVVHAPYRQIDPLACSTCACLTASPWSCEPNPKQRIWVDH